jgi:hypothetical protein
VETAMAESRQEDFQYWTAKRKPALVSERLDSVRSLIESVREGEADAEQILVRGRSMALKDTGERPAASSGLLPAAVKIVAFVGIYRVLHYLVDWFPGTISRIFSGIDESVFQHLKLGFWAYALASIGELLIRRLTIGDKRAFVFSRALSVVIVPWLIFLLWYGVAAVFGPMPNDTVEVLAAIAIIISCGAILAPLEALTQRVRPGVGALVSVLVLVLVSILVYTAFSFGRPWVDLYQQPPGR